MHQPATCITASLPPPQHIAPFPPASASDTEPRSSAARQILARLPALLSYCCSPLFWPFVPLMGSTPLRPPPALPLLPYTLTFRRPPACSKQATSRQDGDGINHGARHRAHRGIWDVLPASAASFSVPTRVNAHVGPLAQRSLGSGLLQVRARNPAQALGKRCKKAAALSSRVQVRPEDWPLFRRCLAPASQDKLTRALPAATSGPASSVWGGTSRCTRLSQQHPRRRRTYRCFIPCSWPP